MTSRLYFSIGPVQGFVAQSRRTRDLWGSSYLLSFLSAHAMHGIAKSGGEIVEPNVKDDPLYQWVQGHRGGATPRIGSLPNHFAVEIPEDNSGAVACAGVRAFEEAWRKVSEAVWEKFIEHASCTFGHGTEQIWKRQVHSFWEIMWAVGPKESRPLARRKHWRSHRPPEEPGDKCTIMHDLQELSGYTRSLGSHDRKRQGEFWKCVRNRTGSLDLKDGEQLCAIALVKRLFPRVPEQALGWEVDAQRWPSTIRVGAEPWIRRVQEAIPQQADQYAEALKKSAPDGILSEQPLDDTAHASSKSAGDFSRLDANYYHRTFLSDERQCPLEEDHTRAQSEKLLELLEKIYHAKDATGRKKIGPPSSFYALLLADGDRLGRLASRIGKEKIGCALANFTQEVQKVVEKHGGQTIYAGGDDVLAMHPVPEALRCATKLKNCYTKAFEKACDGKRPDDATLSATVLFAHVRLPLSAVISEAHRLLDNVAKDENGRDSVAVGVLKSGGLNCQWVSTWSRANGEDAVACLDKMVKSLEGSAREPGLSSALIYRIREMLTRLCVWDSWHPGSWSAVPADLDMPALLRAEIKHSLEVRTGEGQDVDDAQTAGLVDPLWELMQQSCAASDGNTDKGGDGKVKKVGLDALLLARFLARTVHGEVER